MKTSLQIAAFVIATALPSYVVAQDVVQDVVVEEKIVYVTRTGNPPIHTPAVMPSAISAESAQGQVLPVASIPASVVSPIITPTVPIFTPTTTIAASSAAGGAIVAPDVPLGDGVMRIIIDNRWDKPLSVSFGDNAGSPGALGSPTAGPLGTATTVVYPTGWAGRIYVGSTTNGANTKIEGSTTGANDIDISYVDGYSVPITCSNKESPITGCNLDLFAMNSCPNLVGNNDLCLNPMQGVADGPASPFFLPCQGAAYTFPNDNIANNGDTRSVDVTCCIGTAAMGCKAPDRQGKGNNRPSKLKREAEEEAAPAEKRHENVHKNHMARHLRNAKARHQGHGMARGLKDMV